LQHRRRTFRSKTFIKKDGREREHHLAENVVLDVPGGAVADPHRTVAAKARPFRQDVLVEIRTTVDAIERRQIQLRVRPRDVEQKANEVLALVELPEQPKSAEHVGRVSQPTIAVVPRAAALRGLGNGGRRRRHDGARVLETVQLEGQRRADDLILENWRNIAVLNPALPVAPGLHQESLGQGRQRLFHRSAIRQHQVMPLREREGATVEVRQRNVRGQADLTAEAFVAHVIRPRENRGLGLGKAEARLAQHAHARRAFDGLDDAEELRRVKISVILLKARRKIDHAEGARRRPKSRHQNVGVVLVFGNASLALLFRPDEETSAVLLVEQRGKHGVGIETRKAAPHHRARIFHQR
jgi:hypothetical protein